MTSRKASITRVQRFKAGRLWAPVLNMLGMSTLMGGLASNASANEDVPFEVLRGDQCYMFSQLVRYQVKGNYTIALPLELVINNEEDYRKLFDPADSSPKCNKVA
jgi:hypothetical protein